MFDETQAPYFKSLPKWLQKDIIAQRNKEIERERERDNNRQGSIDRKCTIRGYPLFPTRGDMQFPPLRNRSRRPVGDFSILGEPDV